MGFTREIIWRKCDMNGAICFYYCTCVLIVLFVFIYYRVVLGPNKSN